MSDTIHLSPFYNSAVNAVTQPNKITWCSDYFIDRWMPLLGGEGTRIVLALRRQGYNNRKTGVKREEIQMDLAELAQLAGCSVDTISRQVGGVNPKTQHPFNPWMSYFVKKRNIKRRNKAGHLRQEDNGYWVSMDDPIHPDDWHLVEAYVVAHEGITNKGIENEDLAPEPQNAEPDARPEPQNADSAPQNAVGVPQNAGQQPQNAVRYNEESDSSLLQLTLPDAARLGLAMPFPEKHRTWAALTVPERAPYVTIAERELKAMYPDHASSIKPRMIEVRARNLFETGAKVNSETGADINFETDNKTKQEGKKR